MIKTLTPIGNSLGLIIDRPILNLLNIDRDTELEITTDGTTLTIRPAHSKASKKATTVPKQTSQHHNNKKHPASVKDAARSFLDEFKDALK